ncbi:hypothetical protein PGC08_05480 [Brevibacterium sp. BDJS002]|uniref:hypothetical protein n=1 Tax=Brevibacterium sp. BDJS002 TaxID=3020906 RepID=UPI0023070973|nr:hypothetical protein [Brevibacterium sp. BDJS002]MDN5551982.1 hypothetical protein [Brevibacterium sp.]WCE41137.1 hypothetical protein PGC08_05480 [Brevibacterium sp. BDJS002]
MRDIVFAVILGNAFGMSMMSGAQAFDEGSDSWILQLIVFPLAAAAGIVSLLLKQRKRASAQGRHPNSHDTDQEPEQPR